MIQAPRANEPERGGGLRTAGVLVAALGGAVLVTGAVLNLKVNQMASDLEKPGNYSRSTESRRADYATLTQVSYGVGGACLLGGVVVYLLGRSAGQADATSTAFVPTLGRGGVSAVFKGAF
jgi:hypothetical protein